MLNSNVFVYNFLTSLSGLFCGWQSCHQSRVMRFRAGSAYNCCYFVISGWHWSTLHPICGNNVCVLQIVDLFFLKVKLFFLHLCHSSYHKWNTVHSICQLAPKLCFISLCEGGNYFLFFKKQTFLLHQKQDVFFCCEKQSNNLKKDNHESWGLSSYIKIDNWWAGFFNDTLSSETIKKGGNQRIGHCRALSKIFTIITIHDSPDKGNSPRSPYPEFLYPKPWLNILYSPIANCKLSSNNIHTPWPTCLQLREKLFSVHIQKA